jgi:ATP-dependent DNA helicase RecG
MSATPIPRTLALIIYGDLDVSVIDELPPGRQKVDTYAVGEDMRERINKFIAKLVGEGRQVYIICHAIDENEAYNYASVETYYEKLKTEIFPDIPIACLHGKMKGTEKDEIMRAFKDGETKILVSTTVIEVGVDVPNAALIVIENAERFGLSQLHQLRGRVGRGSHQSYCVLVSGADSEDARRRLAVMKETTDGFKIAGEDLRLRGPGDFFGNRQHGLPEMHIADLCADMDVLSAAQAAAKELLEADPRLEKPEHAALRQEADRLIAAQGDTFN